MFSVVIIERSDGSGVPTVLMSSFTASVMGGGVLVGCGLGVLVCVGLIVRVDEGACPVSMGTGV